MNEFYGPKVLNRQPAGPALALFETTLGNFSCGQRPLPKQDFRLIPEGRVANYLPPMRVCGNGHQIGDDAFQFCPTCGVSLVPASTEPPAELASSAGAPVVEEEPSGANDESVYDHLAAIRDRAAAARRSEQSTEPVARSALRVRRWRRKRLWIPGAIAAVVVLILIAIAAGQSGGGHAKGTDASSATPCSSYSTSSASPPQTCISRTGLACSSYDASARPTDCLGHTQRVVHDVVDADGNGCKSDRTKYGLCPSDKYFGLKPAEARTKRRTAAKALAAARARAAAREAARRHAAAVAAARARAAANAWHQGYFQQDDNVYWKWLNGRNCSDDFEGNGCWHVEVITRDGCSSYVAVNANEYQGGTIINQLLANQGYGIPPETPRIFELDSDTPASVTASDVQIDCE